MDQPSLAARPREATGKGAARKLRRQDRIPAVFYGPGTAPIMLAVDRSALEGLIKRTGGENLLLDLHLETPEGKATKKALLKELQVDPVKGTYLHADFYEISMDKEIQINLRVQLVNTPVGVTNGGVLQHVRREISVVCLPDRMTDTLEVDVSALDIGDVLHVEDIPFPEGVRPAEEGRLTVAVVAAPTVSREAAEEEEEEEEAAAEAAEEAAEEPAAEE
ncbi:MAG: 50S ribosomal protein L25/general stress protein Ctc [Deltaproteobacteria bacterium]|nr:50S ribosomal protein L25/general stress protein Ctc [Deltaproteobacteria bacterium]MBW1924932.1 50S ribosomal protein L25/general stress protein Ctc [Deltaproteobacteria bacterium]MBW1949424.1 50S ribosomal protein L25/general stress protein Ctc [Deltaproteobacteria bacterium]MBW2008262.1 50S ribosomal protein L25/general stress protein Ctc [Deltaproteobacteria bacterium]MBW2101220.1 50S ribosomal protein L25/general stress protein Ctc [Deltaproteobacteria bacterium]